MDSDTSVVFQKQLKLQEGKVQKNCLLVLTADFLSWGLVENPTQPEQGSSEISGLSKHSSVVRVRVAWVLQTELVDIAGESGEQPQSKLIVHHVVRTQRADQSSDLSLNQVTFVGPKGDCTDAVQAVKAEISKKVPNRPKSLLVIINPVSGKGKAQQVYRNEVAPVFSLCGIQTDVQVTQRAKHSDEILDKYDLTKVDGVLAVGGDGTFAEVVNALLKRTMKDAGADKNDPDGKLQTPAVTCSMVSGGSSNGHPLFAGFSKKASSSALMIAIGHSQMMDVLAVHCDRQFIAYALLMVGYGQMARVFSVMENNRWAGPARYLALPFCLFLKRNVIEVEVEYLPAETSQEVGVTSPNEDSPDSPTEGAVGPAVPEASWKKMSGKCLGVDSVAINPYDPNDDKPCFTQESLDDGKIRLWMTRECARMAQIGFFNKLKKSDHTAFHADFLECTVATAYRVRAVGATANGNIKENLAMIWDGDLLYLPEPHFEVKNHPSVLRIFSRDDGEELRQSYLQASKDVKP